MDLILWRHAEAEDGFPDLERKLTELGRKQANKVSQWLREALPNEPDRVIVSPAVRTQSTAKAFTDQFETSKKVGVAATPEQILLAAGWPDAGGTVLVVGHQPTLGQTAALLLSGREDYWSVKKGAIWWLVSRHRNGEDQVVLKAVLNPDLV
jgi:phosphohistidine phosphatase